MKPNIANAVVRGEIHAPTELTLLTQDMLEVELANGVVIDVGWYPEHDPNGTYGVVAFQGHPDRPIGKPYYTKDPKAVLAKVESLAKDILRHKKKVAT
jgi:hypothetical protein